MNVTLTCKCGKKMNVGIEHAGKILTCRACGHKSKVPTPSTAPLPDEDEVKLQELPSAAVAAKQSVAPSALDDEEIKLQDLPPSRAVAEEGGMAQESAQPELDAEPIQEDAGTSYGLDAKDGRADLDTGTGMYGTIGAIGLPMQASCIAYGSKGDWALAGQANEVLLLNMKSKKRIADFAEHEADITSVALSATEPLALSADADGEIRCWPLASCKSKKKIKAHDDAVNAVALSPDGTLAASGGADGCIHLWDLTTGKRKELEYADWGDEWEEEVTFVSFSRDGTRILAGGSEGHISLWKVDTGKRVKRFAGLDLPISCVRLSDEGGQVTATTRPIQSGGSSYLVISHWETRTGEPLNRFNLEVESIPCCIAPDRGGVRVIIAGGSDPWMGVFSLENGRCLHAYNELRGTPVSLAVSPKNNRVLAALSNSKLQLFGLEPH